jgi:CheY-like chemotaxis protein
MSTTRKYGGSGLGLTICDRLVKMMGGEMSVRSAPDQGSTFYFTATFDIAPESVARPDQHITGLNGMKVLLCDANPAQLVAISELLQQWEMRCQTTDNVSDALLVLEQDATTDSPFELAIFDARKGGSDQRRLIQKLRARAALQSLPVVLMMPVSASRPRTRTEGDPRVRRVSKPFSHLEFKQAIAQAVGQSLPVLDQPSVETAPGRALNILLAEDNEINIRFARGLLQGLGHTVSIAQNGLEAVKAVGASMDSPFDLVLMDVQMPIMSGLEATSAIRVLERGTSQHLPIIAMTANAMRGDRERCLEAGMDDYLSKPIAIAKLLEAINRNLASPTKSVVTANPPTEAPRAGFASPMHADEIAEGARPYDRQAILETLHGDMDALRELAQMFMTDHRLMLDEARRMIDVDNIDGLARVAHTLKGMIGNFAAAEASKAAEDVL